jgi:hypothetical protein
MRVVAVHQPNFLPWLGYFDKMQRADVFVLYDDCPLSKPSWTTRVKIIGHSGPAWLSVPVINKKDRDRKILSIEINDQKRWRDKAERTLTQVYGKAPFFQEVAELIFPVLGDISNGKLADLNISLLDRVANALEIVTPWVRSSSLGGSEARGTERLVELVQAVDGCCYLCGDGSAEYMKPALFAEADLEISYLNFNPPQYRQTGQREFVAGLSIFDVVAELGVMGAANLLSKAKPRT